MRARIGPVPLPGSGIGTGFPFAQWVPSICADGGSRPAHAVTLQCTPPRPSYSSRRNGPDPARGPPTLPLTAEYRHDATAPSIFRASCFGSSDDRFARQNRYGPPSGFPLTSSWPGIVHHLSGPNVYALGAPLLAMRTRRPGSAGRRHSGRASILPRSDKSGLQFHCAFRCFKHPNDSRTFWRTEEPGTSTVILVSASLRPARTPDKRWRSDTCVPYRPTIGRATRGPGARYGRSFPASRATAGAVDRRPTGRDVLLREKCGPPRPA
ncbi:hypothetical protein J6590_077243 [Homalodisca vitripennis]|nr:hypothetical protein J6590_077243 [Homalodisca vitripennis]